MPKFESEDIRSILNCISPAEQKGEGMDTNDYYKRIKGLRRACTGADVSVTLHVQVKKESGEWLIPQSKEEI